MAYIQPNEVVSPKKSISNLRPIYDKGEDAFSVALLDWDQERRVAIRWNDHKPSPGNPQSRGLPTWFVVPEVFDISILETLLTNGLLGGGTIDRTAAEQDIRHALSLRQVKKFSSESIADDFETRVIQIIEKLIAEGRLSGLRSKTVS
jgi:hypothetical protein